MLSNNSKSIPVLIIGYSRLNAIRDLAHKLLNYEVKDVYLAIDYSADALVASQQRTLVSELSQQFSRRNTELHVWHRNRNHGVAVGVLSALDWFFSSNAVGIVIEDDLTFEEDFLEFCAASLVHFEDNREVLMISGNRYDGAAMKTEVVLTNYPQIWGWATWGTKWPEIRDLILDDKRPNYLRLRKKNICYFYAGAVRARSGLVDTWDTPLAYEMLLRKRLCVLPPVNLVSNLGADHYAAHTRNNTFPLNYPLGRIREVTFPSLEEMKEGCEKQNNYLERYVFRIKLRHLLSPMKLWLFLCYGKVQRKNIIPLELRLRDAEQFEI
jgi:hypothetical protein